MRRRASGPKFSAPTGLRARVAFGWILLPFYGAVFWAVILALLFSPLYRRLLVRMRGRRNLAALSTLLVCLLIPLNLRQA